MKLQTLSIVALFFRAWLYYRDDRPMRALVAWRTDSPLPETFPDINKAWPSPETRRHNMLLPGAALPQ
jgi:hypothetical protein